MENFTIDVGFIVSIASAIATIAAAVGIISKYLKKTLNKQIKESMEESSGEYKKYFNQELLELKNTIQSYIENQHEQNEQVRKCLLSSTRDRINQAHDYYMKKGLKGNSLVDIRTSRSTTEYLESIGFPPTIWKVGHAFAKLKIREIDGIFGGELAGHYYFRKDFFNCDSGVLASLLVLSVVKSLKENGETLSSFIDSIVKYSNTGEVNFKLDEKDECIAAILSHYEKEGPMKVLDFDGYRIEFPSWWLSVRKSNTEPYLRIVLEARSEAEKDARMKEIEGIIAKFK